MHLRNTTTILGPIHITHYTSAANLFIVTFPYEVAKLMLQESGHQLAQAQLQLAKTFQVKLHCYKVAF